ncbi:helicase-related protein [Streptomyces sp. NPDC004014]
MKPPVDGFRWSAGEDCPGRLRARRPSNSSSAPCARPGTRRARPAGRRGCPGGRQRRSDLRRSLLGSALGSLLDLAVRGTARGRSRIRCGVCVRGVHHVSLLARPLGEALLDEGAGIFASFAAADTAILADSKLIAEGVDIPSVDAIVFADPTRSVIRCVQALGRALRLDVSGKSASLILPVCIPPDAEAENILGR